MTQSARSVKLALIPAALAALAIAMGGCSEALTNGLTVVPGGAGGLVKFEIATKRTGGNFEIVGQEVTNPAEFQIVTSSTAVCGVGAFAVANNAPQNCSPTVKALNPGTGVEAFLKTKWQHVGKGDETTFSRIKAP